MAMNQENIKYKESSISICVDAVRKRCLRDNNESRKLRKNKNIDNIRTGDCYRVNNEEELQDESAILSSLGVLFGHHDPSAEHIISVCSSLKILLTSVHNEPSIFMSKVDLKQLAKNLVSILIKHISNENIVSEVTGILVNLSYGSKIVTELLRDTLCESGLMYLIFSKNEEIRTNSLWTIVHVMIDYRQDVLKSGFIEKLASFSSYTDLDPTSEFVGTLCWALWSIMSSKLNDYFDGVSTMLLPLICGLIQLQSLPKKSMVDLVRTLEIISVVEPKKISSIIGFICSALLNLDENNDIDLAEPCIYILVNITASNDAELNNIVHAHSLSICLKWLTCDAVTHVVIQLMSHIVVGTEYEANTYPSDQINVFINHNLIPVMLRLPKNKMSVLTMIEIPYFMHNFTLAATHDQIYPYLNILIETVKIYIDAFNIPNNNIPIYAENVPTLLSNLMATIGNILDKQPSIEALRDTRTELINHSIFEFFENIPYTLFYSNCFLSVDKFIEKIKMLPA